MVSLSDVKLYLRIDTDDEDNLLNNLIDTAESYLRDAIDDFDNTYALADTEWKAKADQAELFLVCDWYENRLPKASVVGSSVSLLITQLQLHTESNLADTEGDTNEAG